MNELWLPIKGWGDLYEVSSIGRVKSLERVVKCGPHFSLLKAKPETILVPSFRGNYLKVGLYYKGRKETKSIHRLVCEAFIENPDNLPHINHKNGIKTDNQLENLEWVTPQNNIIHAYANDLIKKTMGEKHRRALKVYCATLGIEFNCISEAARELGINKHGIIRTSKNRQVHTQGFYFRYI